MTVPRRVGAVSIIAGVIVLILGTMLHPMDADPNDAVAAFTEYAADDDWVASHLVQFLGVALMFVGLVALNDAITNESSAWLARLGVFFAVAALSIAAALQAVDGIALKIMVDSWANTTVEQKDNAFQGAFAVRQIEVGIASFFAMLFGTTVVLFGLALAVSTIFSTSLGWIGVVGGAGTGFGGLLTAYAGFSIAAMNVSMPFNLIVGVWMVLVGFRLWRLA